MPTTLPFANKTWGNVINVQSQKIWEALEPQIYIFFFIIFIFFFIQRFWIKKKQFYQTFKTRSRILACSEKEMKFQIKRKTFFPLKNKTICNKTFHYEFENLPQIKTMNISFPCIIFLFLIIPHLVFPMMSSTRLLVVFCHCKTPLAHKEPIYIMKQFNIQNVLYKNCKKFTRNINYIL